MLRKFAAKLLRQKKKIKDSHSEDMNLRDVRASLNLTSSLIHSAGQLLRNTFSCGLA